MSPERPEEKRIVIEMRLERFEKWKGLTWYTLSGLKTEDQSQEPRLTSSFYKLRRTADPKPIGSRKTTSFPFNHRKWILPTACLHNPGSRFFSRASRMEHNPAESLNLAFWDLSELNLCYFKSLNLW